MDANIIEEIMEKHLKADASISLFFIGLDTVFYILLLVTLGCDFKNFFSPKQTLSQVILLDVLLRIFGLYFNKFDYEIINEIVYSFFATIQFFLLNNILKKLFRDEYYDGKESLEIKSPLLFSGMFLFLTFNLNLSKIASLLQCIIAILTIIGYSYYIQSRISLFLINLEGKRLHITCKNMQHNLAYLIALYFVLFYLLKIGLLFIEHKLYYSYMLMACDIFKEGGKFLLFGLMMLLVNSFNKFIKDEDREQSGDREYIY